MTAIWCMVAVAVIVVFFAVVAVLRRGSSGSGDSSGLEQARKLFHLRREWLEAEFLTLVSASGKPRGLIWSECEFADEVVFATDRNTGQLRAFAAVVVRFKAEEGGEMEGNPNVGNLRAATAVFHFDDAQWVTEGRAVFNLNPLETVERFHCELQSVD